jgi:hypothetical protein
VLLLLLLLQGISDFTDAKKTAIIAAATSDDHGEELV